ncbi:protocadherin-9-like [Saccostrea cucullata]|uniref:protocadherin-9-like n=1 Tax=Saccostrea cuccullata TaxID=36930 RepID=UPI002ED2FF5D
MELWMLVLIFPLHFAFGQIVEYSLPEEKAPNTYIGNVAQDANISGLAQTEDLLNMEYRILSQSNPYAELFSINEKDANLYTAKQIDRETVCKFDEKCILKVDVIARSSSGNFYQKIQLNLQILDINDNYPKFSRGSIDVELSEGSSVGTSVQIEGAIDADTGMYAVQNYVISPNDSPFDVHFQKNVDGSSIVKLVLREALNREDREYYLIQVLAQDGGNPPRSGILNVNVYVTDVNDNSPVFITSNLNVTIDEDAAINSTILVVRATDADKGNNSVIVYSISERQDLRIQTLFGIERYTGRLLLKESLIFEPGESYKIIVEASDSAKQPRISQTQVIVNVNDTHNNPPQITVDPLSGTADAEISEKAKFGAPVSHITVFDPDTGYNGRVNCSVDDKAFAVQQFGEPSGYKVEYKVVVNQPLDRENLGVYRVTVLCEDEGHPKLNASATFHVRLIDENDNYPVFSQKVYQIMKAENNEVGDVLLQVTATDEDTGDNSMIKYHLQPSVYNFGIDSVTGLVKILFKMDRETVNEYRLIVYAVDQGEDPKTGSAEILVQVSDLNDNAPVFENDNLNFNVPENFGRNVTVGVLLVSDGDSGENNRVSFSIDPKSKPGLPFEVFSNGSMIAVNSLDREEHSAYTFDVIAKDHGVPSQSTRANVTVRVLDMNDNAPVFIFPTINNNTVTISYQTQPNQVIAHLKSKDSDEGLNSKVTYLTPGRNLSNLFQLNTLSGRIILTRAPNEEDVGSYTMLVYAQDKGTPPKITQAFLTIVISNIPLDGANISPVQQEHKFYIIAIAITCVTGVIAVVIILTICLIKRADRLKMKYQQSHNECEVNQGFEPRKKVSFSMDAPDSPKVVTHVTSNQLYSALANQVAGSSRLNYQPRYHNEMYDRQRSQNTSTSNKALHNTTHEGDNHSINSADTATSDSGRGGSDDMNTSSMFPSSLDFDQDSRTRSNRSNSSHHERDKSKSQTTPPSDFFNLDFSYGSNVYPNLNSSYPHGLVPYNTTGNDDSTTTSGSYVLDPEEEMKEVTQPSNRCIV